MIWVGKAFAQIWVISEGGPGRATTTLPVYAYQVAQSLHRYDLGAVVSMLTVLLLVLALLFPPPADVHARRPRMRPAACLRNLLALLVSRGRRSSPCTGWC